MRPLRPTDRGSGDRAHNARGRVRSETDRVHSTKLAVFQRSTHRRVRSHSPEIHRLKERRWPAEWEPHSATWLGWPHHRPDWPGKFEPIPWVYAEIVRVLHARERVEVLCHSEEVRDEALAALSSHGVGLDRCRLHLVPSDRVWLRDSGPSMVWRTDGTVEAVCWRFNAWAKYENHKVDALIAPTVAHLAGVPAREAYRPDR